ncbi:hypothetical protein PSTG_15045 [Puccinia striiformis f. sp. tritici PST-78]|uniref:Tet-like 2OG-Fe(II) oxygenase domain-containing protein n=1 Tax=Puccinia striiformis f. sp. tritici PST-78 TaxID=1165861 RepID=A0A0L0UXR9_9BASI|nr:hypothetical protein PSTG_15045 [Puccinia striiformis f. sp. tritici PST-78]
MFTTDFIAYADSSRKKVVAVVKFHAFSKMDKSLKDRFQHLSHHPVAQSKFQNPNESNAHTYAGKMFSLEHAYAGKMFSLGWRKAFEPDTKIGIQGIAKKVAADPLKFATLQEDVPGINKFIGERFQHVSQRLYEEVKQQYDELKAPTLAPGFRYDEDGFTCHLSFTWDNFANKSHTDNDASSWTFVTWLPMDKKNENLIKTPLDVCGGEFVLPKLGFGIDFSGFKGVVECVWKATTWAHLTLPSSSPAESVHTQCGYSCQLPEKTRNALQKMRDNYYENHPTQSHYTIRDKVRLLAASFAYNQIRIE